jgi:hypothetical protein
MSCEFSKHMYKVCFNLFIMFQTYVHTFNDFKFFDVNYCYDLTKCIFLEDFATFSILNDIYGYKHILYLNIYYVLDSTHYM